MSQTLQVCINGQRCIEVTLNWTVEIITPNKSFQMIENIKIIVHRYTLYLRTKYESIKGLTIINN